MSTLLAVILNMFGLDTTIPINCQVNSMSRVLLVVLSDQLFTKGLGHF